MQPEMACYTGKEGAEISADLQTESPEDSFPMATQGTGLQMWVTFASNDWEALQALVLASSLHLVNTTRKIAIIVHGNKIHKDILSLLENKFDYTATNEGQGNGELHPEVFSMLQMWKLTFCDKCIFLDSATLVVKNCDELFESETPRVFVHPAQQDMATVFAFRPTIFTWRQLMEIGSKEEETKEGSKALCKILEQWIKIKGFKNAVTCKYIAVIDEKDCFTRFKEGFPILKPLKSVFLLLDDKENINQSSGMKMFLQTWRSIYHKHVMAFVSDHSHIDFIRNQKPNARPLNGVPVPKTTQILPSMLKNGIAIVGMSCRFPGANNADEFWELMLNGVDAISVVPEGRWNPKETEFANTQAGFLNCPVDEFDRTFFGLSPREINYMDPQQRMLLEVAWEALEDAGINPLELKGSETGVFTGIWRHDYEKLLMKATNFSDEFQRTYLGNSHAASSARISFNLGLNGPNVATESGCSSSMVSVHLACESLRRGDSTLALAGGVNLLVRPFTRDTMFASHVLAGDGRCKTFDESADGFGRAEGCGILVLKKLSHAIRDNDRIMSIIRGSAISQEGTTVSFGTPSKECQELAIIRALEYSAVSPHDVSYVEAHGTGTKIGDPTEISAIAGGYGKNRLNKLIVGSVKTNIGHAESAAGVAGLIKVVLAMKHGVIPPHRNLNVLNPLIDLESIPAEIPLAPVEWKSQENMTLIAGVSSFGISGTNVHMILEEPGIVNRGKRERDEECRYKYKRPLHVLALSAKTDSALDELLRKYSEYLENETNAVIEDIAYTANIGRAHFNHRATIVASSRAELLEKLNSKNINRGKVSDGKPKVVFLFPGQGSQYEGMGKLLYDTHPVFRDAMDYCAHILKEYLGISLLDVMWGQLEKTRENLSKNLNDSLYSQTAIFCIEYSLLQLWKSFGITPDVVIGHSLGEFAAAVAAEILTIEEVLKLVYVRTQLIDNLPPGGMMACKASLKEIQVMMEEFSSDSSNGWIDVACNNSQDQVVLSAKMDTLEKFKGICKEKGMKTHILAATHAYHSRDMESILPEYFEKASTLKHKCASCQFISGMSGSLLQSDSVNAQYWIDHCRHSVNFVAAIQSASEMNCNVFIEIGPQPVLLALAMDNITKDIANISWLPSIKNKESNWTTLLNALSKVYTCGGEINWKGFDSSYIRNKIPLPTYPFERQKYWFESKTDEWSIAFNSSLLHPLIGRKIPLVSQDHVFQNSINIETLTYLEDHQVANKIIIPCTGMLEMVTAAGHAALQGNSNIFSEPLTPLLVENFKVESPLEYEKDSPIHIQTLVSGGVNPNLAGFQVSVHKQSVDEDGFRRWKRHAVARFSPFATPIPEKVDLEKMKRSCKVYDTESMYAQFPNVGLTFGKTFKSIACIWRNEEIVLAQVPISKSLDKIGDYLCHPVLTDAMIQLFAFGMNEITDLFLPVGIQRYVWLARSCSDCVYVLAKLDSGKEIEQNEIYLYDETGNVLATMQGISVVKTSVETFLRSLNLDKVRLPGLYKEVWRSQQGPLTLRAHFQPSSGNNENISERLVHHMKTMKFEANLGSQADHSMDKVCFFYIVNAFLELGWQPTVGQIINSEELVEKLSVLKQHHGIVQRYLEILSEEGLLQCRERKSLEKGSTWEIMDSFPKIEQVRCDISILENLIHASFSEYSEDTKLQNLCGQDLASILRGQKSALEILFPQKKNVPSAEKFYMHSPPMKRGYLTIVSYLRNVIEEINSEGNLGPMLRILEIGSGTGGTSAYVFSELEDLNVRYHYTYTDISPVLLSHAKEKFSKYSKNTEFRVLNIEEDPLGQGFSPFHYDVIIASNVLHATENLEETVIHSRMLLRPFGHFVVYETLKPLRTHDVIFGPLEGYWRFKDHHIRPHHVLIGESSWAKLLRSHDFDSTSTFLSSNYRCGVVVGRASSQLTQSPKTSKCRPQKSWIVISNGNNEAKLFSQKLQFVGREAKTVNEDAIASDCKNTFENLMVDGEELEGIIYFVDKNENEVFSVIKTILNTAQYILSARFKVLPKLVAVTQGAIYIEDQSPKDPFSATVWGFMKTFKNENPNMTVLLIDTDSDEMNIHHTITELYSELWSDSGFDYQVAFRQNKRHVLRLFNLEPFPVELRLPPTERFNILLPKTRAIADLQFITDSKKVLTDNEVEISVRATSLNFRDVMVILRPEGYYTKANTIGTDFSGIISSIGSNVTNLKVGDPVFGMTFSGAISSHTYAPCSSVAIKPSNVTFNEAAALPTVFLTAYYCLVQIADLKIGETVLIHVASGGVGLCAIQIAKSLGAHIIVTAGSKRKREYLRSLGIAHVFHSRNTDYGNDIRKALGGVGVDVVLNSLTSGNFKETTLGVCNKNARFIEMGKVAIWQPHEVASVRADIRYRVIDLEQVDDSVICQMTAKMSSLLEKGEFQPLPYTRFQCTQIREALFHLQKARHIGKLVVTTPTVKTVAPTVEFSNLIFNDESTYLITGGLGGIGLEVTKFMAEQGAKHIVLVNRNPPKEYASGILSELRSNGINVISFQFDVGSFEECEKLLETLKEASFQLPPLRGIMHAAGTLSDGIIPNQSLEKFQTVFHPKVMGAWNLHCLTKSYKLEHFVMFSSVAAILSPMGQSNHSAANFFLDTLAHYRNAKGMVGSSVNWGAWSEIGAASKTTVGTEGSFGVKPFSPNQGISAYKALFNSQQCRVTVVEFDPNGFKAVFPHSRNYLQEIAVVDNISSFENPESNSVMDTDTFWKEMKSLSGDTSQGFLKTQIEILIRQVLKLGSSETVENNQSFIDMGMDSLMNVEMKNKLQLLLGKEISLSSTTLTDFSTVTLLTEFIFTNIQS